MTDPQIHQSHTIDLQLLALVASVIGALVFFLKSLLNRADRAMDANLGHIARLIDQNERVVGAMKGWFEAETETRKLLASDVRAVLQGYQENRRALERITKSLEKISAAQERIVQKMDS